MTQKDLHKTTREMLKAYKSNEYSVLAGICITLQNAGITTEQLYAELERQEVDAGIQWELTTLCET